MARPSTAAGGPGSSARRRPTPAAFARALIFCLVAAVGIVARPAAAADKVRIGGLTDLAFGTVSNLTSDAVLSEDLCVYSGSRTNGYYVTATGTGPGNTFALSSGSNSLVYDVAWSSSAGQSAGSLLSSNVPLTGQVSAGNQQTCNSGPATTASLIVILRAAALSSATAGSYTGTLTILIGPE